MLSKRAGLPVELIEYPVANGVVGDMVSERLRHAAEALAADRDDRLAELFGLGLGNGLDVVADEPDRALGLNGDAFIERKELLNLIHDLGELFVAAEDDVFFLEIGGELHRHERVHAGRADIIVAARPQEYWPQPTGPWLM